MSEPEAASEYLVISRGKWDAGVSPEVIQAAIDEFYVWLDGLVARGKMRPGQRLANSGRTVSRRPTVTDGPYGEAKEVIGGYWFILAHSLEEAAEIAAGNPCMRLGLFYEVRPIDPDRCSASMVSAETPEEGAARG